MGLTCLWNVILCVWWVSGLWNEWRAEDGCDLSARRGVERPRPSSPGEESHSKHTKAGYISTNSRTLKLKHFPKVTPNGSVFEYKCRSFLRFYFQGIHESWLEEVGFFSTVPFLKMTRTMHNWRLRTFFRWWEYVIVFFTCL